jgi:hypothetical protein
LDQQNNTALLYSLIFDGLTDQSPETLQKLKGVFIADLDLTIPEVQRILNSSQSVICSGDELGDLELKSKKLQSVGALVTIVSNIEENEDEPESELLEDNNSQTIGESEVELQFEDSDELEFEIELDEPKAPAKPKKAKVHKVEEVSLSDTLKELGIEEVNNESNLSNIEDSQAKEDDLITNFSFEDQEENRELEQSSIEEKNESIKEESKDSQLFSDLTIQDVDTGLELLDELVKEEASNLSDTKQTEDNNKDSITQNETRESKDNNEDDEFNLILEEEPKPEPIPQIEAKSEKKVQNKSELVAEVKEPQPINKINTESVIESVDKLQTQFLKAKEELLESIDNSLNSENENRPTILLKEENVIKTTSNDSVAQIQNESSATIPSGSTKRKKKNFILKNLDTIIAVIVGGVILGFGNYFYFKEPETQKLAERNVNKQIKLIAKTDNDKKQADAEAKKTSKIYQTKLSNEQFSLEAEIKQIKKDYNVEKLEIIIAKPKPLTEEEVIAGIKRDTYLTKIVLDNKALPQNPDSTINQEISFKAYALVKGQNVRYVGKAKLIGQLPTELNQQLALNLQIEQGLTLPNENKLEIQEGADGDLNFGVNLSLMLN